MRREKARVHPNGSPLLKEKTCPACAGVLVSWIEAAPADTALQGSFTLWRCQRCGTARTAGEVPAHAYEAGTYAAVPPRQRRVVDSILAAFAREKVGILRGVASPGTRVLDIGAGRGRFVAAAAAAGFEASGIEPSRQGSSTASAAGADVVQAGIEDAEVPQASLDAATLWHVLEHLEDPGEAVRRIAGWLRPGGVLIVAVPNLASVQAAIGGSRWFHLDVPRHRTHFTTKGLKELMRRADLEPVLERHVLLEHNPYGMWQTWANRITSSPAYLYNLLKRNAAPAPGDFVRTLVAALLIPLAIGVELVAGACRRGGTVVVAARRR